MLLRIQLTAIDRAFEQSRRSWIGDLASIRLEPFAAIAEREGKGRQGKDVRLPAPLAFTRPAPLAAVIKGTAPADII